MALVYPWFRSTWQACLKDIENQRLPQAWLFHGNQGIGKQDFCQQLICRLLCQQPDGDFACSQCPACTQMAAATHPDFRLLTPEEGASTIKIGQWAPILQFAQQTTGVSGRKVIFIAPAEQLNHTISNALLKTLEEPVPGLIFVLMTNALSQILPTLLSRCQAKHLPSPTAEEGAVWLKQHNPEIEITELPAFWLQRPIVLSQQIADPSFVAQRQRIYDCLSDLILGHIEPLQVSTELAALDFKNALHLLDEWLAQMIFSCAHLADPAVIDAHQRSLKQWYSYRDEVVGHLQRIAAGNPANAALALENLMVNLSLNTG